MPCSSSGLIVPAWQATVISLLQGQWSFDHEWAPCSDVYIRAFGAATMFNELSRTCYGTEMWLGVTRLHEIQNQESLKHCIFNELKIPSGIGAQGKKKKINDEVDSTQPVLAHRWLQTDKIHHNYVNEKHAAVLLRESETEREIKADLECELHLLERNVVAPQVTVRIFNTVTC